MGIEHFQIGIHLQGENGFGDRWKAAMQARGIRVKGLDLLGPEPLRQVAGCDGVMWHWFHYPHEVRMAALPILRVIEESLRIPVFPNMSTSWHYDDKIAQSYLLESLGIPCPKTWVFWRKEDALSWCEKATFPLVAKLSGGAGSMNVRLIRSASEASAYVASCFSGSGIVIRPPLANGFRRPFSWVKKMLWRGMQAGPYVWGSRFPDMPDQTYWMPQKNYALFQEFLPENEFDTRVTVIGDRAFAFRRFNRPGDFRASGSGRIDHDPTGIALSCLPVAFDAARKLKSQSMAFDFMFKGVPKEPVVGEISYCYADWAVERCPGHWDSALNWHEGHLWPEEAHVEDFLQQMKNRLGV